ncbi:MAG: hypothetical protein K2Y27_04170 [Xanthobacteraceae bacterium]|nr:hypothetical protein [Xanthobacteraceae bacterium]
MRLVIDNTTRFFPVVGAPYIPESHLDDRCPEHDLHARRDDDPEAAFVPSAAAAGWRPQACRQGACG